MMKAKMEWTVQFIQYLVHRLFDDKLSSIAAVLTLTSLLAVIPFLAVAFSILAVLPQVQNIEDDLQVFIFSNFVPTLSVEIEQTIRGFVQKASAMKPLGFSSLIITAILLLRTIDTAFNQIWRTVRQRKAMVALLVYWLVLILGPLLLGISIALSSYFTSLLIITDTGRQIGSLLTVVLPWFLTTFGLAILYFVIPNTRIKFIHAMVGALVAGLLFEVAKQLFTMYVTSFPLQEIIFGTLSAVPLFLIWVYLSWIVILLGAEICHGLENFKPDYVAESKYHNHFIDCLRILQLIEGNTDKDKKIDRATIIEALGDISDSSITDCLQELLRIGLITATNSGSYSALKSLDQFTVVQFIDAVHWKLPNREMIEESDFQNKLLGKELLAILHNIQQQATYSLRQSYHQV